MGLYMLPLAIGPWQIALIVVVVLLLGGKKIPELMRGLGSGIKEFKDASKEDDKKDDKKNKHCFLKKLPEKHTFFRQFFLLLGLTLIYFNRFNNSLKL